VSQADAMLLTDELHERFSCWEDRLKGKKGIERLGFIEITIPAGK